MVIVVKIMKTILAAGGTEANRPFLGARVVLVGEGSGKR
jgi:hypothetical protein